MVAGNILACRYVQRACQRQLDDLVRYKGKASPYRFNPKLTDKQVRTFYPADHLCMTRYGLRQALNERHP